MLGNGMQGGVSPQLMQLLMLARAQQPQGSSGLGGPMQGQPMPAPTPAGLTAQQGPMQPSNPQQQNAMGSGPQGLPMPNQQLPPGAAAQPQGAMSPQAVQGLMGMLAGSGMQDQGQALSLLKLLAQGQQPQGQMATPVAAGTMQQNPAQGAQLMQMLQGLGGR